MRRGPAVLGKQQGRPGVGATRWPAGVFQERGERLGSAPSAWGHRRQDGHWRPCWCSVPRSWRCWDPGTPGAHRPPSAPASLSPPGPAACPTSSTPAPEPRQGPSVLPRSRLPALPRAVPAAGGCSQAPAWDQGVSLLVTCESREQIPQLMELLAEDIHYTGCLQPALSVSLHGNEDIPEDI